MPISPPVTLAELKAHLNMAAAAGPDDAELTMHLNAAAEVCEGEVGAILHRSVTERTTVRGSAALVTTIPVVSVQTFTNLDGTSYDPAELDVDRAGVIRRRDRALPLGRYDITYTAGIAATSADVPAAIKVAVLIVASHMWETQRGTQARPGFSPTEGIAQVDQAELIRAGFSLPRRALELLKPYALGPAIT